MKVWSISLWYQLISRIISFSKHLFVQSFTSHELLFFLTLFAIFLNLFLAWCALIPFVDPTFLALFFPHVLVLLFFLTLIFQHVIFVQFQVFLFELVFLILIFPHVFSFLLPFLRIICALFPLLFVLTQPLFPL